MSSNIDQDIELLSLDLAKALAQKTQDRVLQWGYSKEHDEFMLISAEPETLQLKQTTNYIWLKEFPSGKRIDVDQAWLRVLWRTCCEIDQRKAEKLAVLNKWKELIL